jgi:hypothetical protein
MPRPRRPAPPPGLTQDQRLNLSLAGEHYVVAELRRRAVHATIAHGNVRQTDVLAFGGGRYVTVEVKATRTGTSWPVSAVGPRAGAWVFVSIPDFPTPLADAPAPAFFVLTRDEVGVLVGRIRADYLRAHPDYKEVNPVWNVKFADVEPHRGAWQKITGLIGEP